MSSKDIQKKKNIFKTKVINWIKYDNCLLDKASDFSTSDSKTFSWISANFSMILEKDPFNFPKLFDWSTYSAKNPSISNWSKVIRCFVRVCSSD